MGIFKLLHRPAHAYTKLLLDAIPRVGELAHSIDTRRL